MDFLTKPVANLLAMAIVRASRKTSVHHTHSAAPLAELVDARDSKSRSFGSAGSIPAGGTIYFLTIH